MIGKNGEYVAATKHGFATWRPCVTSLGNRTYGSLCHTFLARVRRRHDHQRTVLVGWCAGSDPSAARAGARLSPPLSRLPLLGQCAVASDGRWHPLGAGSVDIRLPSAAERQPLRPCMVVGDGCSTCPRDHVDVLGRRGRDTRETSGLCYGAAVARIEAPLALGRPRGLERHDWSALLRLESDARRGSSCALAGGVGSGA